jgi:phosphoesterase RecJ-like protein
MKTDWQPFVEIVRKHERFVLTSHVRPDCDALGSELGMAGVLESLGKQVRIVNPHATPPNLAFIDPQRRIRHLGQDIQAADLADSEVLIVLDTSAWAQLGSMADVVRATTARRVLIDHHVGEDDLKAELFKNVEAEATGRLVVEAADALDVRLTPEIAAPVFAALATDTGWFRFSSTTAETLRLAGRLMDAGADAAAIFNALYEQDTLARVKLRGEILARVVADVDGRLVHTYVRLDDFRRTGALPIDTEDAVNLTLAVAGSEVAVIFVEQKPNAFKISFRSRCRVDCNQVARQFGGGGHKAAAGASVEGPFDEVQGRVLDAVRAAMG